MCIHLSDIQDHHYLNHLGCGCKNVCFPDIGWTNMCRKPPRFCGRNQVSAVFWFPWHRSRLSLFWPQHDSASTDCRCIAIITIWLFNYSSGKWLIYILFYIIYSWMINMMIFWKKAWSLSHSQTVKQKPSALFIPYGELPTFDGSVKVSRQLDVFSSGPPWAKKKIRGKWSCHRQQNMNIIHRLKFSQIEVFTGEIWEHHPQTEVFLGKGEKNMEQHGTTSYA